SSILGEIAAVTEPSVKQVFIAKGDAEQTEFEFNIKLFTARKTAEHTIYSSKVSQANFFYLPSLSTKTIIYKGWLRPEDISVYYQDLHTPLLDAKLALVHQRFSTNTFPTWDLEHTFCYI